MLVLMISVGWIFFFWWFALRVAEGAAMATLRAGSAYTQYNCAQVPQQSHPVLNTTLPKCWGGCGRGALSRGWVNISNCSSYLPVAVVLHD